MDIKKGDYIVQLLLLLFVTPDHSNGPRITSFSSTNHLTASVVPLVSIICNITENMSLLITLDIHEKNLKE